MRARIAGTVGLALAAASLSLSQAAPAAEPAIIPVTGLHPADSSTEPKYAGWTLALDNDALVPAGKDKDYTGGFALTYSGANVTHWPLALHDGVDSVLDAIITHDYKAPRHSYRFGSLVFAPDDLATAEVVPDDRPYASLLFVSSSSIRESADGRRALHGSILIGVLGTNAMASAQRAIHHGLGETIARGWRNQISHGGEPTVSLGLGRQKLWLRHAFGERLRFEAKDVMDVSLGAESGAAYGWAMRFGYFDTPWWAHAPELNGYITSAEPTIHRSTRNEFYASGGIRAKARAYSVYLQGQFRDSNHTLDYGDLRPVMGEAWAGLTWEFIPGYRAGWVMRAQTSEIREGQGDRNLVWGGMFLSKDL